MIKVFQVLECGGPGGTGNQVAAICNGLDPARFETTLVYAVRPGSSPRDFEEACRGASRFVHVPAMVREIAPLKDLSAWLTLLRLFRAERPDVVHTHSSKAGILGRAAARAAGVPKVFHSPRGYGFLQEDRSAASRALYRWAEAAASRIGTVVAISPSEAALAREAVRARKVRTVRDAYLGEIRTDRPLSRSFRSGTPAAETPAAGSPPRGDGLVVAAAGRLSAARRPEAFLRMAGRVAREVPGVRFVWIGDGDGRDRLDALADSLGLHGRFSFTGWLPRGEAETRLAEADVAVHYSSWDGLPNAVIEAMAAGTPVVASDIPGNRNLVKDGETGFLAADEDRLAARVLELLADPALRKRFGRAGVELIRAEYGLDRMLAELSALYAGRML